MPVDPLGGSQCLVARDAERIGRGGFSRPGRLVDIRRTHLEGKAGGPQELGAPR